MAHDSNYPIIIGHKFKKGLFAFRKDGGFNVWIVRLKKQYESGKNFDIGDIKSIEAELHFCDRESVQATIKVLIDILKDWKPQAETEAEDGNV